ncbi:MAG: hypothetical protein LWW87_07200 [Geobacteraceae bacterium]|nr:hypothetical protein [Geobacteraceae bacterium]
MNPELLNHKEISSIIDNAPITVSVACISVPSELMPMLVWICRKFDPP